MWRFTLLVLVLIWSGCQPQVQEPVTSVVADTIVPAPVQAPLNSDALPAIQAVPIPDDLNFAGEAVPLYDDDVYERLDRELLVNTYWQSNTVLMHKRSARWFPMIEEILAEEGIPDDFKFLALIESGFTNARSPAGAAGFWQFVKPTAEGLGLEIRDEVDERYHAAKATRAACQYLRKAYDKFGNWTSAAASYNMGKGGLNNQMTRQHSTDYYDLYLNSETSRYVFRILAVKAILNNSEAYGFHLEESDLYAPYPTGTVTVDSTIADLATWAEMHHSNYKEVKILNPWLRQKSLTVAPGKTYEIILPDMLAPVQ